jgi:hypothetical protein
VAIKTEYRMHFKSEEGEDATSLELSANEPDGELAVWISTPANGHGEHGLFLRLDREEALELKAILGVLTGTASDEEEAAVGAGS